MNNTYNKFHKKYFRAAVCELHPDEEPVQNDLAFTPSRMFELAQEGIPISTQSAALSGSFDEGYRTLDFEPLLEHQRGVDFADLWEKSKDAHTRIAGSIKKARQKGAASE